MENRGLAKLLCCRQHSKLSRKLSGNIPPPPLHNFPTVSFNLLSVGKRLRSVKIFSPSSLLNGRKTQFSYYSVFSFSFRRLRVKTNEMYSSIYIRGVFNEERKCSKRNFPYNDTPLTVPTHLWKLIDVRNLI